MVIYQILILYFTLKHGMIGAVPMQTIDETENQPYTVLILEAPEFIIVAVTDELIPHTVFECSV